MELWSRQLHSFLLICVRYRNKEANMRIKTRESKIIEKKKKRKGRCAGDYGVSKN